MLAFIYEPKHPEGDYLPTLISNKKLTSARGARTGVHGPNPALKLHQFEFMFFLPSKKLLCAFHGTAWWPQVTPKAGELCWDRHTGKLSLTRFKGLLSGDFYVLEARAAEDE